MIMLTPAIAQTIADEVTRRLGHNVNIMDRRGVIIGSGDRARLNTVHEGARRVLERGRAETVSSDQVPVLYGTQPGVNLPVHFNGETVGVVGVTGEPDQVAQLGSAVVLMVELMLAQAAMQHEREWRERLREQLLGELFSGQIEAGAWRHRLALLGVRLRAPCVAWVVRLVQPEDSIDGRLAAASLLEPGRLAARVGSELFVQVAELQFAESTRQAIERLLGELGGRAALLQAVETGIQPTLEALAKALQRSRLAARLLGRPRLALADAEAPVLLHRLAREEREDTSRRLLAGLTQELIETLQVFFENDLNVSLAAQCLKVHRNTLLYRLKRVQDLTGYDARRFHEAATLQVALWLKLQA